MNSRRPRVLIRLVAIVLALGTALSTPVMARIATQGMAQETHHHRHQMPESGQHTGPAGCCELCWTSCATPPEVPAPATLPVATITAFRADLPASPGRLAALRVWHALPFAQGPPAPLM